jgi:hypothetical protein
MATSVPDIREQLGLDIEKTPDDPPTNARGHLICGRERTDDQPCSQTVPLPWVACHQHDTHDPIIL